jgi:hypothetical protein
MGLTRSSSGLLIRDDFGSDTSANYYISDSKTLSVTGGYMTANADSHFTDADKTGMCITSQVYRVTGQTSDAVRLYASASPTNADNSGYELRYLNSSSTYALRRINTATAAGLDTDNTDIPSGTATFIGRLFANAAGVWGWAGTAFPLTATLVSNDTTYGGSTMYDGGLMYVGRRCYWFECRTSHTITCTGLGSGSGYQLQANGSSSYKATESSGTATLDIGVLEWPLTSVEVLNAANAQVAQITSGTLADMGGGDAFAYAADVTFIPKVILL